MNTLKRYIFFLYFLFIVIGFRSAFFFIYLFRVYFGAYNLWNVWGVSVCVRVFVCQVGAFKVGIFCVLNYACWFYNYCQKSVSIMKFHGERS